MKGKLKMEIPAWMVRQRQELVAETFGADPELLPLLPALLADLEALGSSPEKVRLPSSENRQSYPNGRR